MKNNILLLLVCICVVGFAGVYFFYSQPRNKNLNSAERAGQPRDVNLGSTGDRSETNISRPALNHFSYYQEVHTFEFKVKTKYNPKFYQIAIEAYHNGHLINKGVGPRLSFKGDLKNREGVVHIKDNKVVYLFGDQRNSTKGDMVINAEFDTKNLLTYGKFIDSEYSSNKPLFYILFGTTNVLEFDASNSKSLLDSFKGDVLLVSVIR